MNRISRILLSLCILIFVEGCSGEKSGTTSVTSSEPAVNAVTMSLDQGDLASTDDGLHVSGGSTIGSEPVSPNATDVSTGDVQASSASLESTGIADESVREEFDEVRNILNEIRELHLVDSPEDLKRAREARRTRNLKIVELCARALRLIGEDMNRHDQFQLAIGHLLEARLQLALSGTRAEVDQLYGDVQSLNDRDPESAAAAEGIYCLARFAHLKARLETGKKTVWLENFSRWAREFSDRFPQQASRCTALLFGAGRSCELHAFVADTSDEAARLMTEARLCYVELTNRFPDSSEGLESAAVLRRLALPGQVLTQFAGPTTDGGYVSADSFRSQVTVIYFWESTSLEFRNALLPLLRQAAEVSHDRLRFVGVSLDSDRATLDAFLQENDVPGLQIFFSEPEQLAWNSPLVRFWGISKTPAVWLIDRHGKVHAVDVQHHQLVDRMRELFR